MTDMVLSRPFGTRKKTTMANSSKEQVTVIHVRDPRVIALCAERAKQENRTPTNACETTLIEALDPVCGKPPQHTPGGANWQGKIRTKTIPGEPAGGD